MQVGDLVQHRDANRPGCDVGLVTGTDSPQHHMTFVHVQWVQKAKTIKGYMPWELVLVGRTSVPTVEA